jgi:TldD protein
MIDEAILEEAVEHGTKQGAKYLDIRFEEAHATRVGAEDGAPKECYQGSEAGFGIRALAGGAWGFAGFSASKGNVRETLLKQVERAVKMAKAAKGEEIELAPNAAVEDSFKTKVVIDPFTVSMEMKNDLCTEASKIMKETDGISRAYASVGDLRVEKVFFSSEGSRIFQTLTFAFAGLFAIAKSNGETDFYEWGEGKQAGFELVRDNDPTEHARETAQKALELVNAKNCPEQEAHVILDHDFLALLVHEIVGHPSEGDRVLGREAAWAGKTWWAEKRGEKIGSDLVNVVSDASIPGHFGSFKYDDEGVKARKVEHLKQGILTDFLQSRETAKVFGTEANGAMRASSYQFAPLIRMTNTYFEPGSIKKEELFEETKKGIYLIGGKVPSIDSRRYNFQISAKIAYKIKDGEIAEPLRGASLMGVSPEFWGSVDAVCDDLVIRPIPNCGKGDPMQTMMVGNGGPHIRGKGKVVGSKKE